MTEQSTMTEHTITFERVVNAPRELVWRAWTDPDEVTKWWGPEGFTTPRETIEFDLRPGGVCQLTMIGPDGQEYPNAGHYRAVEPPQRVAFGGEVQDSPMLSSAETSVEFTALGDHRTKLILTSRMICVDDLVTMAEVGWNGQLDKLERQLTG